MKQIFLLCSLLSMTIISQATIRRVGYTGTPVQNIDFAYASIQTAHNTASPGDTLQIYQQLANTTAYLTVSKPLKIIGYGHSLNINSGNQIQNLKDSSNNALQIAFDAGSAGSVIQGLNLSYCTIYDSNITVTRCRFKQGYQLSSWNACGTSAPFLYGTSSGYVSIYPYYSNTKNITINGCFFDAYINSASLISFSGSYAVNNLIITNNYFSGNVDLKTSVNGQINGVFANNIINNKFQQLYNVYNWNSNVCTQGFLSYAPQTAYYKVSQFDYFLIKNNIFNTEDTVTCPLEAPNCVIQNNVFSTASQYACAAASSSGNIYKANMSSVFGTLWNNGFVYNDNQLALGASSVAVNAGIKSDNTPTNCGVFGGEAGQSYKLSGIPPVPSFYLLNTPGINANSNPYNITISVKSNN